MNKICLTASELSFWIRVALDSLATDQLSDTTPSIRWSNYVSKYVTWVDIATLRNGRSRDRIPAGGEIFRTRQDRSWGPQWVPGHFEGEMRPERGVNHLPHIAPRLKNDWSCTSIARLGLHGLLWDELYLHLCYNASW